MINLIVAVDKNNGIGKNNDLPWRLPEDLKYFKRTTTGKSILMGRKTFDSIGRPLPNRDNIVITRQEDLKLEGCKVINNYLQLPPLKNELFVIGGAEIFNQTIGIADKLYLTYIDEEFDCDTFFNWEKEDWVLVSQEKGLKDEKNPYDYYFKVYEKRR